jgi:hypothetical protein
MSLPELPTDHIAECWRSQDRNRNKARQRASARRAECTPGARAGREMASQGLGLIA